jgi:S1-C subfamily serine protease
MNENNDMMVLDAVERYIRGEMNPDERLHFENLRKTNSEIDQLVVEHTLFLQQMNRFGEWQRFHSTLNEVHTDLIEQGKINADELKGKAKVVYLWNRYKKVTAIAASIAGITALTMSVLVWSISPKTSNADLEKLDRKLMRNEIKTDILKEKVQDIGNEKIDRDNRKDHPAINYVKGGTAFMIDGKGFMITNAHIVQYSTNITVVNTKGEEFNAFVVQKDPVRDVAIIKIDDSKFKPSVLPFGISKAAPHLAEPIFTLGFPREEIVYGEGYVSARTGYHGDTLSCQITIPANPGNSGGPIFNRNGEVIGILSSKETGTEGAVFAIQSKYIYQAIDEVRKNPIYQTVRLSSKSLLMGMDNQQQVGKISDYVFMVKGD